LYPPQKNSPEVVKQRPGVAVVFLSGYTEEVISQSDKITGFTLVEKPYTAATLLHSIRRSLDESAAQQPLSVKQQ
jgi:FixJ family two-component response regulator